MDSRCLTDEDPSPPSAALPYPDGWHGTVQFAPDSPFGFLSIVAILMFALVFALIGSVFYLRRERASRRETKKKVLEHPDKGLGLLVRESFAGGWRALVFVFGPLFVGMALDALFGTSISELFQ